MTPQGSLYRKYVVYFVAMVSTALTVSGLVGLYYTYQESKTARLNLQREKADAAAERIDGFVREIERQVRWVSIGRGGTPSVESVRLDYLALLGEVLAIAEVRHIDDSGRERLRVSRRDVEYVDSGIDFSDDPRFAGVRPGTTYFSPVYIHRKTDPYLSISVRGPGNSPGVTAAEVNLKFIRDVVTRISAGTRGVAYVVDAGGRLIAHPDILQVLKGTDLASLDQVRAALLPPATGAGDRVMVARDGAGSEVLVAYASIPKLGWHVFVQQPIEDAFEPLYDSLLRTGLLLLAGLALAAGVSLVVARRMVTPIRTIQAGAARIAGGDLDQRINVQTDDELGVLASEFNHMARQLKDSYAGLERKIENRTRDLTEALEQQTAISEVLRTISRSSFDLEPVLQELVVSVVRLGRADAAGLYLRQPNGMYELRVSHRRPDRLPLLDESAVRWIDPGSNTASARAIASHTAVQIDDVTRDPGYAWPGAGYRTALAVPILREDQPVGIVVALRAEPEPFESVHVNLITTFADQAGIAVGNVRLFEEIQAKGRELELANRHKSEFLANVSHELRTPLNAIIGMSEALCTRIFGDLNDKQLDYLQDVHSSGKDLLALINDILDLAKVEAGRMDLVPVWFDLDGLLVRTVGLMRERARRKDIVVRLDGGPPLGGWVGDELKFKQIMLNLLSNAVKFTKPGGEVVVRARRAEHAISVAVIDTGIGIPPEHIESIFEPFIQVDGRAGDGSEGTGLGLPLTKKLVELHGGTIRVESVLGVGSTFEFTLPERELEAA